MSSVAHKEFNFGRGFGINIVPLINSLYSDNVFITTYIYIKVSYNCYLEILFIISEEFNPLFPI